MMNKTRNDLTNYDVRYKRVNFDLFAAYNSLPPFLSKLSHIIFYNIIRTIKHGPAGEAKGINENKRIYSDIDITIEDILEEFYSIKYGNGKDISNDRSNVIKRINELLDYNIFYCWKYKEHYMFVLEREFGIWKIYNKYGCIIPRTTKKIAVLASDMIKRMAKFEKKKNERVKIEEIENSFGMFINLEVIERMNPLVAAELPRWDGNGNIYSYLKELLRVLREMHEFKGFNESDDFLRLLPKSISRKLHKKRVKEANDMKTKMEKELIPKDPNLVKVKKEKSKKESKEEGKEAKKKKAKNKDGSKPKTYSYKGSVDPFKNSKEFVRYYRSILYHYDNGVRFENFAVDTHSAGMILDDLGEKEKKDKTFLKSWIRFYKDYNLKGLKIYNSKHTSLKAFKESFDKFNNFYHVSQ